MTDISWQVDGARAVAADENAMEKEIEQAWKQLLDAMGNLRLKPDKDLLDDLIRQAQSIDTSVYTEESVQAFTAALAQAVSVFDNDQADKEQVEEAQSALKAALAGLTAKTEAVQETAEPAQPAQETELKAQKQAAGTQEVRAQEAREL